jgi:predicted DNA-binding transcriptional regulator YafY
MLSVVFVYSGTMRASRLLSILILLQLRGRMTAQALADEFEVSVRTIYRDIDALSMAGIPIYGDSGPGGGIQLVDGYRTRLTGLRPEEAEALLLIGMPNEASAMGLGVATEQARRKLLAALPGTAGVEAQRIAARFHLDPSDWYRSRRPVPFLAQVARAVLDQRVLHMDYQSWTARRTWLVEPWGLVLKAGGWYLVGHGQSKTRMFNVADILGLETGAPCAKPPDNFDLVDWWRQALSDFDARLRPMQAQLRASPLALERLAMLGDFAARAAADASPPDPAGWREIVLPIESIESAATMLLGIGPEIAILSPTDLRKAVRAMAQAMIDRMEETSND